MNRRLVDVFAQDRLIASYPVVIEDKYPAVSDADFIEHIKARLHRSHPAFDVSAVRFIVRNPTEQQEET
jgi:hypothetical protein